MPGLYTQPLGRGGLMLRAQPLVACAEGGCGGGGDGSGHPPDLSIEVGIQSKKY